MTACTGLVLEYNEAQYQLSTEQTQCDPSERIEIARLGMEWKGY